MKIYPNIALAAINANHGGAWRLLAAAKEIDAQGRGWIESDELRRKVLDYGVNGGTYRRWFLDALDTGFFRGQNRGKVWLSSPHAVAKLLEMAELGIQATITCDLSRLFKNGWRKIVWAAYLTTLPQEGLCSQKTKETITGVSPRRQRNYQKTIGTATINVCDRGEGTEQDAAAWREIFGLTVFHYRGRLTQRLPDTRSVPNDVAVKAKIGRAREEQDKLESSIKAESNKGKPLRLFFSDTKEAEKAGRKPSAQQLSPHERPETFGKLQKQHGRVTWRVYR
jgi:hypothetical protein